MHVVQSALSTSIKKLEDELAVELFDRSRQQIRLTPAGERLREHARHLIRSARLAKDSLSDLRGHLTGTVDFGSLVTFGKLDVARVLGQFHAAHPSVRIRLRLSQSGSSAYLSSIADGTIDLALVSAPDRRQPGVDMQVIAEEPMVFVCRADHRLADAGRVSIADLDTEDLVGSPLGSASDGCSTTRSPPRAPLGGRRTRCPRTSPSQRHSSATASAPRSCRPARPRGSPT